MNEKLRAFLKAKGISENASRDVIVAALQKATGTGELTFYESIIMAGMTPEQARATVAKLNAATVEMVAGDGDDMNAKLMGMLAEHGQTRAAPEHGQGRRISGVSLEKSVALHKKTGAQVLHAGKPITGSSEFERMKTGILFRMRALRTPGIGNVIRPLSSDEKDILNDYIFAEPWCGELGGKEGVFSGAEVKSLISDGVSGGAALDPTFFDSQLFLSEILHSELLPYITRRPAPTGSTVQGALIAHPEVEWGIPEGTASTLASTAGLVTEIDATFHPMTCLCQVGRDVLNDSPALVGEYLETAIAEKFAAEMDRIVAAGSGSGEPAGISTTSGIALVTSTNGVAGPPVVNDFEQVVFAVDKAYRRADLSPGFISNDTLFGRARGINVGPTDERRVFGMDHSSYQLFNWPARICNDLGNSVLLYGAMKKFVMYTKPGTDFRWEGGGLELAKTNTLLLVGRRRVAARLADPAAFAKCVTMEA